MKRVQGTWLLLLLLILLPIKYLSIDVGGFDLSAFRALLIILAPVTVARVFLSDRYSVAWRTVARTPVMRAVKLFVGWLAIGLILTLAFSPDRQLHMRGIAWVLSMAGTAYVFPSVLLTELLYRQNGLRVLRIASGVWFALVAAGLVQTAVFLLGFPVNPEFIAEPVPPPTSTILGIEFLRPYSVFGEPRRLGAIMIGLALLYVFLRGRTQLRKWHVIVLAVLGALVSSVSFYVYAGLFLLYYLLLTRSGLHGRAAKVAVVAILAGASVTGILIGSVNVQELTPRLAALQQDFQTRDTGFGWETLPSAPDLLLAPYVGDLIRGNLTVPELLVGNGSGTFSNVAEEYLTQVYGPGAVSAYRGSYTGPIGSRILAFTLLAESGLIGLFLFGLLFWRTFRSVKTIPALAPSQQSILKMIVVALFLSSVINVSYIFVLAYITVLYIQLRPVSSSAPDRLGGPPAVEIPPAGPLPHG